jgi:hypothetical protein
MTGNLQWFLLIMSCVSLAGLGLSGFLVSRAQNYRAKRDARLAMVVTPHIRAQRLEISAFTRAPKPRDQSLIGMASWILGFDPGTPDRYPLRWWLVAGIALAVSKAAQTPALRNAGVARLAGHSCHLGRSVPRLLRLVRSPPARTAPGAIP